MFDLFSWNLQVNYNYIALSSLSNLMVVNTQKKIQVRMSDPDQQAQTNGLEGLLVYDWMWLGFYQVMSMQSDDKMKIGSNLSKGP